MQSVKPDTTSDIYQYHQAFFEFEWPRVLEECKTYQESIQHAARLAYAAKRRRADLIDRVLVLLVLIVVFIGIAALGFMFPYEPPAG